MLGPIDNERKACDAVARSLEALENARRLNPRCPEVDGDGAPVDYVFELAGKTHALEHTIVEAFPRQIHTGVGFVRLVAPIQETLNRQLPSPGKYQLIFPTDPCQGLTASDIPKVQAAIIAWVEKKAAELHSECPEEPSRLTEPGGHRNYRSERPDGLNFELHLSRETGWWMPEKAKGRTTQYRSNEPCFDRSDP